MLRTYLATKLKKRYFWRRQLLVLSLAVERVLYFAFSSIQNSLFKMVARYFSACLGISTNEWKRMTLRSKSNAILCPSTARGTAAQWPAWPWIPNFNDPKKTLSRIDLNRTANHDKTLLNKLGNFRIYKLLNCSSNCSSRHPTYLKLIRDETRISL